MKKGILILTVFFLCGGVVFPASVSIAGFADAVYMRDFDGNYTFSLNQFELGIEAKPADRIVFEGAVCYDVANEKFDAGAALINFALVGKEALILSFGKFDVPFGLTAGMYASPDNAFVSVPLANEGTVNGWNNVGIRLSGKQSILSWSIYLLDGSMDEITVEDNGLALGISTTFEFGKSLSVNIGWALNAHDAVLTYHFLTADVTLKMKPLSLMGGVILKSRDGLIKDQDTGIFGQLEFDLSGIVGADLALMGRFGYLDTDAGGSTTRISAGVKYSPVKFFELRAVFESDDSRPDTLSLQALVSF